VSIATPALSTDFSLGLCRLTKITLTNYVSKRYLVLAGERKLFLENNDQYAFGYLWPAICTCFVWNDSRSMMRWWSNLTNDFFTIIWIGIAWSSYAKYQHQASRHCDETMNRVLQRFLRGHIDVHDIPSSQATSALVTPKRLQ